MRKKNDNYPEVTFSYYPRYMSKTMFVVAHYNTSHI